MTKYGGRWDAWRKWLDHDRRLRGLEGYGDIIFQDAVGGSDAQEGTVDAPVQNLLEAIARVTNNNNDIIIHKGLENLAASVEFNKTKTTLLGWAGRGANPTFPEHGSIYRSVAEDLPVIDISADFVEIAGIAMAGNWVTAGTAGQGALGVRGGANKAFIHHCFFTDWGYGSNTAGLVLAGPHYTVIEDCEFESVWDNMDCGLYVGGSWTGSGTDQPAHTRIKRCTFMGQGTGGQPMDIGIGFSDPCTHQNWGVEKCNFVNVTNAIDLGTEAKLWAYVRNCVGSMQGANFLLGDGDCDTIANAALDYEVILADIWGRDGPLTS